MSASPRHSGAIYMRSDASASEDSDDQDSPMSFAKSPTPQGRESQGNKPGTPSRGSQRASATPSQNKPGTPASRRASQAHNQGNSTSPPLTTLKKYDDSPPGLGIPTPPKDPIYSPSIADSNSSQKITDYYATGISKSMTGLSPSSSAAKSPTPQKSATPRSRSPTPSKPQTPVKWASPRRTPSKTPTPAKSASGPASKSPTPAASRPQSRSPTPSKSTSRPASKSPTPVASRPRSRSPTPAKPQTPVKWTSPRSKSPTPSQSASRPRSRSPTPVKSTPRQRSKSPTPVVSSSRTKTSSRRVSVKDEESKMNQTPQSKAPRRSARLATSGWKDKVKTMMSALKSSGRKSESSQKVNESIDSSDTEVTDSEMGSQELEELSSAKPSAKKSRVSK